MGKVGSTAISRSLDSVGIVSRHLQWVTPETQAFMDKVLQVNPNSIPGALNRLNQMRAYNALRDPEYASIIKVVTAIRAPIELILSHYFHSLEEYYRHIDFGTPIEPGAIIENILKGARHFLKRSNRSISDLTNEFSIETRNLVLFCWTVFNYLHWFDLELLPFFPIPILGGRVTDGYQIGGNVMILRFEDLNMHGEKAIAAYSQRPHFKLLRDNVGADKNYGALYGEVLRTIKFPPAFVDYLCDSKYVRHFYSEKERSAQKERWTQ